LHNKPFGKVLISGISSFTGYHFSKLLSLNGFEVIGIITKQFKEYDYISSLRINKIRDKIEIIENTKFGDKKFQDIITDYKPDLFCMHHAYTHNHNSENFDIKQALKSNLNNIEKTISTLVENDCEKIIYTGSIFEANLETNQKDYNNYGTSKRESFENLISHVGKRMELQKFTICNPIGLYESKRLSSYLIKNWMEERVPFLDNPNLIRDFIPIDLLSNSYFKFATQNENKIMAPSCYVKTNLEFALILKQLLEKKLSRTFKLEYRSVDKSDPCKRDIRVGVDPVFFQNSIEENTFWEDYIDFLLSTNNT